MSNIAVIEDATVLRMLNDKQLVDDIPCLYGKRDIFKNNVGGGCGSCAKRRNAQLRTAFNQIKTCLTGLSSEKRQVLKNWLGAENARITYTNGSGKVVQVNF